MKRLSLLAILCVLLGFSSRAQTTTTVEKKTNRITITTSKVDESGRQVTETWIAEGEQPETILKEMAIHPDILQKIEAVSPEEAKDGERLFLFRRAGDQQTIEGKLSEGALSREGAPATTQSVIVIRDVNQEGIEQCRKISTWSCQGDTPGAYYHSGENRKANCAAMGVFVSSNGEATGCHINSVIDLGGAQAAGLKEGDIITRIDDFDVADFASLYQAMSNFMPGDNVLVRYERDGKSAKARVHLTSWADLPGHEWRARQDCDQPKTGREDPVDPPLEDDPNHLTGVSTLQLEDARIFPNPTEGLFSFSFTSKPGPVSVSIADVNGKVVYEEAAENSTGFYNRDMDLKEYPSGNYVISVKQGDKVFTRQIVKQ